MFEHAPHLAVLAFGQGHFDPAVLPAAALQICLDPTIAHSIDRDAFDQFVELGLGHVPERAGAVGAAHGVGGQFQRAFERAVIGQQQQALGIEIEATDRHQPGRIFGQCVAQSRVDGRSTLRIAFGRQKAGWLVEGVKLRRFGLGYRFAVDRDTAKAIQLDRRCIERLAVQRDAAVADHALDLAPAGDPRAGEQFGNPVAVAGQGFFAHGKGR